MPSMELMGPTIVWVGFYIHPDEEFEVPEGAGEVEPVKLQLIKYGDLEEVVGFGALLLNPTTDQERLDRTETAGRSFIPAIKKQFSQLGIKKEVQVCTYSEPIKPTN